MSAPPAILTSVLINQLSPDGQGIDAGAIDRVAYARINRGDDRAARADRDGRLDDVLVPVTRAGGNVAGQCETLKRREGDVVRAAHARLQHPAAPDGRVTLAADALHTASFRVTADAPELDVNNPARAHLNSMPRILARMNGLVQADGSSDLSLQQRMIEYVVMSERLFDHHQIELVQRAKK